RRPEDAPMDHRRDRGVAAAAGWRAIDRVGVIGDPVVARAAGGAGTYTITRHGRIEEPQIAELGMPNELFASERGRKLVSLPAVRECLAVARKLVDERGPARPPDQPR